MEGRGNISEMVEYFENSSPEIPWERALGLWVSMVTPELSGNDGLAGVLVVLRLVLLAMALLYFRGRKGGAFHGALALTCIVLHGVSLFSVGQVEENSSNTWLSGYGWSPCFQPSRFSALRLSLREPGTGNRPPQYPALSLSVRPCCFS